MNMTRLSMLTLLALCQSAALADSHILEIHAVAQKQDATTKWYSRSLPNAAPEAVFLEREILMDESAVEAAWVEHNQDGDPMVRVKFTADGTRLFGEITEKLHPNRRLGFVVAGQLISAPVIRVPIFGGDAIISGMLNETEASRIAGELSQKRAQ
jgi:preprotein translocase subunit SecD